MNVQVNVNLKPFHTFGIDIPCDFLVEAANVDDVIDAYQNPQWKQLPKLILGKGSNVLFTEPFHGVIITNQLLGKKVTESDKLFHLHIAGGEDWPSLVEWTLSQGIYGLENLALIPGCVGSAPIQNIGAYGVEFKDVCEYVEYLDLDTLTITRLNSDQCLFAYRDSVFKQSLLGKVVIVAVGLKLNKAWKANLSYGPLQAEKDILTTPQAIFDLVCDIRRSKLPDPSVTGNAGSFFKNPVITTENFNRLKTAYPELSGYPMTEGGVKIAAGWLIDRCGLKGHQIGGAQVHPQQALVIVNAGEATSKDILDLAWFIRQTVSHKYGVDLEHEVRFFDSEHETNLNNIFTENHV
ncbi:UDP-N-acetylmuramate dehydrogenase [Vibrio rumoiensis]|uniref:UDP-N-acetylenolpyruvoylglucosamine reductase n=1 Tax=Vibrio rumoiensis 1S-45 TaxID=1188252 RepID=A0A1E5E173_9VIBR|nr:UDP-N-acetylmuramate dehydrogenase [Vibrio rumoiensis]OEF24360.1 UDP-N-acetylenolpyruvoylglucosamine reductase [Vibrio rumoiensis 1S-45]